MKINQRNVGCDAPASGFLVTELPGHGAETLGRRS
jgi:hypothetical protein